MHTQTKSFHILDKNCLHKLDFDALLRQINPNDSEDLIVLNEHCAYMPCGVEQVGASNLMITFHTDF